MTMLMNRLLTVMQIQQPTDVENPQRVMASKTGCRWLGSEHDPRWRTRITGIRSESHYQVINGDHPHWTLNYNPRLNLPIRVKSASGCTALGLVLTDLYPIKIACSCGIPNGLSSEYCGIPKILPTYSNIIIQNCLQLFIFVLWILSQIAVFAAFCGQSRLEALVWVLLGDWPLLGRGPCLDIYQCRNTPFLLMLDVACSNSF